MNVLLRALVALSLALAAAGAFAQAPDTILLNGKIVTADEGGNVHQALAVRDGRIVALGKSAAIKRLTGKNTRVVDLGGRTVIPGLTDSHIHAIRAALSFATEVHWFGTASIEEALGRLRDAARAAKPGAWLVVAGGWTEEQFKERRRPTQAELVAAAPDNPVYVQWMYGWAMLTPQAYKALNINAESDLPAGRQVRARCRAAIRPVRSPGASSPLFDKLPTPAFEQKVEGTRKFFRELNRVGLTGVVDPGGFNMSPAEYAPLFRVWRDKALSVRVNVQLFFAKARQGARRIQGADAAPADGLRRRHAQVQRHRRARHLRHVQQRQTHRRRQGGVLPGRQVGGRARHDADAALAQRCFRRPSARRVRARQPRSADCAQLRWSIAHLNDGTEATFARMKALGVGWAMQDAMYYEGERALKEKGEAALKRMPPMRTALKTGVVVGAGTDAHRVANYNPFVALRWMLDGKSAGGMALRGAGGNPGPHRSAAHVHQRQRVVRA